MRAAGARAGRSGFLGVLAVIVVVAMLVATPFLFVLPASDSPQSIRAGGQVDAVVVLGGAPQERFDAATELAAVLPEPPPLIALSVQYEAPVVECGSTPLLPRVELLCFSPDPATTAGEAEWIATTATERGWTRIVVTTSDYHVTRTRLLVERCLGALSPGTEALYQSADTRAATLRGAWRIATEWPSLVATPWDHSPACEE